MTQYLIFNIFVFLEQVKKRRMKLLTGKMQLCPPVKKRKEFILLSFSVATMQLFSSLNCTA
jgi:hypothetical protein